jgi:adenine specific DNA methylase Mod
MLNHELMKQKVDLFQGRISKSVSVRHYWSLAIKGLRDRVFRALK